MEAYKPWVRQNRQLITSLEGIANNILSGNWRGQLTTLKPKLSDKEEQKKVERRYGEFMKYILVSGRPFVFVPENSDHCPNLLFENRASFIIGHSDPPGLMKAYAKMNRVPPHVSLIGTLSLPEDDDMVNVDIVKSLIKKRRLDLDQTVQNANTGAQAILKSGRSSLVMHVKALSAMQECQGEDTFYKFDPSTCLFVDGPDKKITINIEKLEESSWDVLAFLVPVIVDGINRSNERRLGIKLLCAWYLRVHVEDAFVSSADRWGLNILAKIAVDTKDSNDVTTKRPQLTEAADPHVTFEWKDLRLAFAKEVEDLNEFCSILAQMERTSLTGFHELQTRMMEESKQEHAVNT